MAIFVMQIAGGVMQMAGGVMQIGLHAVEIEIFVMWAASGVTLLVMEMTPVGSVVSQRAVREVRTPVRMSEASSGALRGRLLVLPGTVVMFVVRLCVMACIRPAAVDILLLLS